MHLGTVIGRVIASQKMEALEGVKLLIVRPEDDTGARKGPDLVMTERGPAGIGDRVWWIEGREATLALTEVYVPVDAGIVAVVDSVDVDEAAASRGGARTAGGGKLVAEKRAKRGRRS